VKKEHHADKPIFYACLAIAVILLVFGAVTPPPAIIDGSILTAAAILLGFAALAIVGQNLANGKEATFTHGQTEITIGDGDDEQDA
jgi:hypothetical protein